MNDQPWVKEIRLAVNGIEQKVFEYIPNLVTALAVIALGLLLAFMVRTLVRKLIHGIESLIAGKGWGEGNLGPAANWIGKISFWIINFFFLSVASEILGLEVVTTWLGGLTNYLPKVMAAILIGFIGFLVAHVLKDVITRALQTADFAYANAAGRVAELALMLITIIVCIRQVGIEIEFLTYALLLLMGALLSGAALAFGLGAKLVVSNILSSHYVQKQFKVGEKIRVEEVEGRIVEMTPTNIAIETDKGIVRIPASRFQNVSTLIYSGAV